MQLRSAGWTVIAAAGVALAGCSARSVDDRSQVTDGLQFDYGLAPAAAPSAPPSSHPDASMHSGPPIHANGYHVVLSVADAGTGRRITDADAAMTISGPGHPGFSAAPMDPMTASGELTYARYVVLPEPGPYRIEFRVRRPGQHQPVTARFTLQRPS